MFNQLDLSGKWKIRWADGQRGGLKFHPQAVVDESRWIDADVPGEVHLSLIREGLISDPYRNSNCLSSRWVEECYWSYRREFNAPDEALQAKSWLLFEGLDYHADIYLNGKHIGTHSNYFYPCRIDITGILKKGMNTIVVVLDGGLFCVSEKSVKGYYPRHEDLKLHKRIWLRKPQCSFGWDWSTRYINVGIHKPVYLQWAEHAAVEDFVPLTGLNDDFTEGSVTCRLFAEGIRQEDQPAEITLDIKALTDSGMEAATVTSTKKIITIKKGHQIFEIQDSIGNPSLWWPVGHGPQNLYNATISLIMDGRIIFRKSKKIGFRKVGLNQSDHPVAGKYFILEVNNRKIFVKGANFVPADMIFANIGRSRYERLVNYALEANFNFLRVWGGGLYENDEFYDLCDEKGILVWQEFIFACGTYPGFDEQFYEDVKKEAVYNVRRLASHPSLVVWCGNNEIEWGNYHRTDWFRYPDHALYHHLFPGIIKEEDPEKIYLPSSPYSPGGEYPNRDDMGDQHPWSIGFNNIDFFEYRKMSCRFPDEGGVLGPTSLKTMHMCLGEGRKYVHSFDWEIHDNGIEQYCAHSVPDSIVEYFTGKKASRMIVEEYTYYAGLLQGEGLKEYIDNFRRRMFDSAAAVFWMYNDCWPATRSWTIVDYMLRKTPSFHPVKRAFSTPSVILAHDSEKKEINIFGVNDGIKDWCGVLRFGVFTLDGIYIADETEDIIIHQNSSECIRKLPDKLWFDIGTKKSIAFAMLLEKGNITSSNITSRNSVPGNIAPDNINPNNSVPGNITPDEYCLVSRNRLFLHKYNEMEWADCDIGDIKIHRDDGYAIFTSKKYIWGACIDLDGEDDVKDNFFDIWPDIDYRIPWDREKPLPSIIRIGNLNREV